MIQMHYRRGPYGLGLSTVEGDAATHTAIEVIDDLSFSERAVFAGGADAVAGWITPHEPPAVDGVAPTYETARAISSKRVGFAFRLLGGIVAPLVASRFTTKKRAKLELAGWMAIGFFRPILGTAAAAVRSGT